MAPKTSRPRTVSAASRVPRRQTRVPLLACKQRCHTKDAQNNLSRRQRTDRKHCLQASSGTHHASIGARAAFSLLEVVLSLAILGGAMAVLGEAVRNAMENARIARDLTDAQLFCESKMAELEAGLLTTDPVSDMPIEPLSESMLESTSDPEDVTWLYSVVTDLVDDEGLVLVCITVSQDPDTVKTPVSFSMTRMVLDESMISTETTTEE